MCFSSPWSLKTRAENEELSRPPRRRGLGRKSSWSQRSKKRGRSHDYGKKKRHDKYQPSSTAPPSTPAPESFSLAPNMLWDALKWEQNGIVPDFIGDLNLDTFEEQLPLGFRPYTITDPSMWPEDHINYGYTVDIFAYTFKNGGGVEHIYHKTIGDTAVALGYYNFVQNEDDLWVLPGGPIHFSDVMFREWDADNFVHPAYSNAKMVTAATFMAAVIDTGLTTLDTPLKELLPDIFGPESDAIQGAEVTPRMIMSHTSGLAPIDQLMTKDVCYADIPISHLYLDYNGTMTTEKCMTWLATHPDAKVNEPLEVRRYANSPFNILGVVVERLTGKTWEEAFQEHIAKPLGMWDSTYTNCTDPRYASVCMSSAHNPKLANGLCTTAKDFAKFVKFLLEFTIPSSHGVAATGVLSRKSALTMMTRQEALADQTRYVYDDNMGTEFLDCARCMSGLYIPQKNVTTSSKCFIEGLPEVSGISSSFGYGQGLSIQYGSKTQLLVHGSTAGQMTIMAPGRFAVLFSTAYKGLDVEYMVQRAVDLLEQANVFTVNYQGHSFNLSNCPTAIERPDWTPDYRYLEPSLRS